MSSGGGIVPRKGHKKSLRSRLELRGRRSSRRVARYHLSLRRLYRESPHALPQIVGDRRRLEGREIDDAHGPRRAQPLLARDAARERELERAAAQTRDPKVDIERLAQP